jgi:hypothetical protein
MTLTMLTTVALQSAAPPGSAALAAMVAGSIFETGEREPFTPMPFLGPARKLPPDKDLSGDV